jgi:hypothetical protein
LYASYPGERATAARALGELGGEAAIAIDDLRTRLRDSSGPVRDAAKWALLKIDPDGEEDQWRSGIKRDLRDFQNLFCNTNLESYFDVILEAEDLLVSVVGQSRYDGYHSQIASILYEVALMQKAKNERNNSDFDEHQHIATSLLDALKKRISGIRVRAQEI